MPTLINDYIKRYGYKGVVEKFICKALSLIGIDVSIWNLLAIDVDTKSIVIDDGLQFVQLIFENFKEQQLCNPGWFTNEKVALIEDALKHEGNIAFGVYNDRLLICYGFISTVFMGTENVRLHNTDAYFWDDYVHPDYRGRKLHQLLNAYRIKKTIEFGKSRCISIVGNFNRASLVGYKRLGFMVIQTFCKIKIFNKLENSTLQY